MKICKLFQNFNQIYHSDGSMRLCPWLKPEFWCVGKLTEQTMEEIWNGPKARFLFDKLVNHDYSVCDVRRCAYLINNSDPPLVEIDKFPEHPTELALAYDHVCNYNCVTCSGVHEESFNKLNEKQNILDAKKIEENIALILPHIKAISANGCGELFVSKNILRVLANWRPLAPKEECSVYLETNGLFFDEEHWKQIENLGQYNVTVVITVMSFDEHTYQVLSGVKYPISKIENNLRFVKSLREKGILNHVRLTTVIQERNFRELPKWFRRCIEEFGADSVRMRAYITANHVTPEEGWITDIRGKDHPYHQEYLDMLKDPIFKDPNFRPKLLDWGLFVPHEHPVPYKKEKILREKESKILCKLLTDDSDLDKLENILQENGGKVIIHGAGALGRIITKYLQERGKVKIEHITDFKQCGEFLNIPIVNLNERDDNNNPIPNSYDKSLPVLFTWLESEQKHFDYFRSLDYTGKFIKMDEIFDLDCDCCK